ncbi:hypothetical protein VTL71DRAFT_4442 [Oculimacula yallundae]|uniref:Uncharacterized protein n=1 Tax=Oculimacula yallundae TaxID=86028 RepID=A0ABR4C224_9HELO
MLEGMPISEVRNANTWTRMITQTDDKSKRKAMTTSNQTSTVRSSIRKTARTFDTIAQNIKLKRPEEKVRRSLATANMKTEENNIEEPKKCETHEESPIEKQHPGSKAKPEFPTPKYHEELTNIQAKLDLVFTTKLIETYTIRDGRASMQYRLKNLTARTKSLFADLKNRKRFYAIANRLLSGDGLDANMGRLDRDVMWFVAELKCGQISSESTATIVE